MSRQGSAARRIAGRLRRPSPAMCVSLVALFLSAGGASYAAIKLPAHSVGATQLRSFAVTNPKLGVNSVGSRKIMPGAVGFYRVNRNEVQLRVTGSCTGANQAITSVSVTGSTTCGTSSSSPVESDSGVGKATTIAAGTTPTTVATYSAAGGSAYLVQADPAIEVSGTAGTAGDHVTVTCKLAAGTSVGAVSTQNVTVDIDAAGDTAYTSLPLNVVAPASPNAETISLSCTQSSTGTTKPTVAATATIYSVGVTQPVAATAAAARH